MNLPEVVPMTASERSLPPRGQAKVLLTGLCFTFLTLFVAPLGWAIRSWGKKPA